MNDPPLLLSVGMMRTSDKLDSYRVLADALGSLKDRPWYALLVGDGPYRAEYTRTAAEQVRQRTQHLSEAFGAADAASGAPGQRAPALLEAHEGGAGHVDRERDGVARCVGKRLGQ